MSQPPSTPVVLSEVAGPGRSPGCGTCVLCDKPVPSDRGVELALRLAVRDLVRRGTEAGVTVEPWSLPDGGFFVAVGTEASATVDVGSRFMRGVFDAVVHGRPTCVRDDFARYPWLEGLPWATDTSGLVDNRVGLLALTEERDGSRAVVHRVGGWAPGVTDPETAAVASALVSDVAADRLLSWDDLVALGVAAVGVASAPGA